MSVEILRPSGAGYLMSLAKVPTGNSGYDCIDEESIDVDDYVWLISASGGWCFFTLPTPSNITESDIINSVTIYAYSARSSTSYNLYSDIGVYIGTTRYAKGQFLPAGSYTLYSWECSTNPATGVAWTLQDIIDMEAGVFCKGDGYRNVKCYQAWVSVDYTVYSGSWFGTMGG